MLAKTLLIVSDKFHHFTIHKDVITKSEIYHLLNTENSIFPKKIKIKLIPGQGFSKRAVNDLLIMADTGKNAQYFDFSLWFTLPERASKKLTHKHSEENILISDPERNSKNEFTMSILIDEECEMMGDHQTGLHIQGLLLVEAARQAYLATMEKFFTNDLNEKNYFIFNNLNIDYNRFAFPLPSSIRLRVKKIEKINNKRIETLTKIEILQCKEKSASILMDVTIIPNNRFSVMENRLANQSLNEHFNCFVNDKIFNKVAHV